MPHMLTVPFFQLMWQFSLWPVSAGVPWIISPANATVTLLLQLEERRQSDASHKDASRKSRGAVTRDNPVWQAIRLVLAPYDMYHVDRIAGTVDTLHNYVASVTADNNTQAVILSTASCVCNPTQLQLIATQQTSAAGQA